MKIIEYLIRVIGSDASLDLNADTFLTRLSSGVLTLGTTKGGTDGSLKVATATAHDNSQKAATTAYADELSPNLAGVWANEGIPIESVGSGVASLGVNNAVICYRWSTLKRGLMSKVLYTIATAGAAGALFDIGLYSSGGVLLAHIGATSGTVAGTFASALVAPYQIEPGDYYVAFTANDKTILFAAWVISRAFTILNAGSTKYAGTATASVNGVLNNTLGAISASTLTFPYAFLSQV